MKKSEAIKKIMEMVNYHDGGHMEGYVANNLVYFLTEQLGMLPPERDNPKSKGMNYIEIMHSGTQLKINEWEPEDED